MCVQLSSEPCKLALCISTSTWSSSLLRDVFFPSVFWVERAQRPLRAVVPCSSQFMLFFKRKHTDRLFPWITIIRMSVTKLSLPIYTEMCFVFLMGIFKVIMLWSDLIPCFIYQEHFPTPPVGLKGRDRLKCHDRTSVKCYICIFCGL